MTAWSTEIFGSVWPQLAEHPVLVRRAPRAGDRGQAGVQRGLLALQLGEEDVRTRHTNMLAFQRYRPDCDVLDRPPRRSASP